MKRHIHHIHIIILAGILALASGLVVLNSYLEKAYLSNPVEFGASFSPRWAKELKLDPKQIFISLLDLGVKNIRLSAYWDEIEPEIDHFYFDDLDWYINEAEKKNAKVILAVGYKLPRWPECRAPRWLDLSNLSYLRERQLIMVEEVISYYNNNSTITAFQIENEPLLPFGECPPVDRKFLNSELKLVKSISKKPILLTDAGELRPWVTPMRVSDIFGTTLYRKVYNGFWGDLYYPFTPSFYRLKSDLVRKFFAPQNQKTIISELQSEPWANQLIITLPIDDQIKRFSLNQLKETVNFAKKTGFDEIYIWGVEWWYYLSFHGHPEYLEYAKGLF